MMKRIRFVGLRLALLLMCAVSVKAKADPVDIFFFDFDGTLMEDRQVKNGAFNAKFIIYRIHQRLNLLQVQATGPDEIVITQQDYHKIKDHLGAGEGRPGSIGREVELQNGKKIQPADYYIRNPDSFRYFREGEPGDNRLLQAFKDAEKSAVGTDWRGPMWNLFVDLCATQKGADSVAIITARGHSKAEWAEFYEYLRQKKYIRFKPDPEMAYNMTRPEFDTHSGQGGAYGADLINIPERKAKLIYEILMYLRTVHPGAGKRHTVMFADNSQDNLDRVAKVFRTIAFGDLSPVKMVLVNVGLVKEVRDSERPEVSVIEPGSKTFLSLPREGFFRASAPGIKHSAPRARTCEMLFARSI